ncbi:MAG: transketolase [Clostridiales bacterium]|nr:transketolase [Clostridiales bacterium]MDY4655075.1 transketolase [Eubacteriales bacterium]
MALTKQEWLRLEEKANDLRNLALQTTHWAGGGHIGGCLSAIDLMTALYYKYLNFDPKNYTDPDRDRLIISKGHIGIAIAATFADLGLIDKEDLKGFNSTGSKLAVHLDSKKVPGLEVSTGSLGHGSCIALGMAMAAKIQNKDYKTYVILGDGECNEGSVWEAAMATSSYNATNLITIVDRNHNMIDGNTEDVMKLEPFADKWEAFGFDVKVINGHRFDEICEAIEYARNAKEKPVCIIADTVKGAGISFMENNYKWHYGAIDDEKLLACQADLQKYYEARRNAAEKEGK